MRSVTFGNSFKLVLQNTTPDFQRERLMRDYGQPDSDTQQAKDLAFRLKLEQDYDKEEALKRVRDLLVRERGIECLSTPTNGFLLTAGPDQQQDSLALYRRVRRDNPHLVDDPSRDKEFEQKLVEARVVDPEKNPTIVVTYRTEDGDKVQLTNAPDIVQAISPRRLWSSIPR